MNVNTRRLTRLSLYTLVIACASCQHNEMQQGNETGGAGHISNTMTKLHCTQCLVTYPRTNRSRTP